MPAINPNLSMPTPQQPLTGEEGPDRVTQVWWRFFFGLFNRNASTIPYLVESGITATGTTQADAYELSAEWNEVTTVPVNSGAILFEFGEGLETTVWNAGANPLKIYPPVGVQINALGVNNPFTMAAGTSRVFYQLSDVLFRTL